MGMPVNYPKPDLSRFSSRQIQISTNRNSLEWDLHEWVADVVRYTNTRGSKANKAETILMDTAKDSIDELMQTAPLSMALHGSGRKQTVHGHFYLARDPNGHWYVNTVSFGLNVGAAQMQLARQRAKKQRLLDRAEIENSRHIHFRQICFPAEQHVDKWHQEVEFGDTLIMAAIERAYENAREDAKMLENPVTPADMALDMAGLGVQTFAGEAAGGKKLEKTIEGLSDEDRLGYELANMPQILAEEKMAGARTLEHVHKGADIGESGLGIGGAMREKEKSTGDKVLETGKELSGFIPGAGPFVKTIAGMMFDIAISSDASRVTKLRSRCYVYFVAGYIHQLTLSDTGIPPRKLDKKYFNLGVARAPGPNSPGSFRAQVSLMSYASQHYTDGGWNGLGYKADDWHVPDGYITKWSPELLGRALATQLHKREYLIG